MGISWEYGNRTWVSSGGLGDLHFRCSRRAVSVETILVVDDEDAIRAVVRKVLGANPDTPGAGQGLCSKVRDRRRSAGGDPPGVLGIVREP